MDRETIDLLEFNQVLSIVSGYAQTEAGRDSVRKIRPGKGLRELDKDRDEIAEMQRLVAFGKRLALGHLEPASDLLRELEGSAQPLEPAGLCSILEYLKAAADIRALFSPDESPQLAARGRRLVFPSMLKAELEKYLTPDGDIKESALPDLLRVRKDLQKAGNEVRKSLEKHLKGPSARYLIPEPYITRRGDRFVIPVKSEFQGSINGLVHGSSSSGATVFLEPIETVQLNNKIIWLNSREQQIILQLLGRLTSMARESLAELRNIVSGIGEFDRLNSLAEFGGKFKCVLPRITEGGEFYLRNARHPLLYSSLPEDKVVPISLNLSEEESILIISGPNTGGKTAALKTLGLLGLMALAGMPVPADDAVIPHFSNILADIGDHQSITQKLSSFSSHVLRVQAILKARDSGSLILLDELGRGTDPVYGGALSMAVAETLRAEKTMAVVTTHHRALKTWAAATRGAKNASVRLDPGTLLPTYELDFGVAGGSSGLEIASQLGLDEGVIAKAREFMDEGELEIENYLEELRNELKRLKALEDILREKTRETEVWRDSLEKEALAAEKKRDREFQKQVEQLGREFTRKTDRFLKRTADRFEAARVKAEAQQKEAALKEAFLRKMREEKQSEKGPVPSEKGSLSIGDTVYDRLFRKQGILVELKQGNAVIDVDGKRINSNPDRLTRVESVEVTRKPSRNTEVTIIEDTSRELNLIGKRVEESLDLLDKFIDRAYLSNLEEVRVIHGFGTGALKKAVSEFLNGHQQVAGISDEGGATLVTLK